ncbi:GGDEF domain-containing protein [Couchioplanes caeruleus]|uniref:GGDEF domain-containing protein n=1 Tax=Couchioplanes caeruleus TaxID=56438 RepID=UPI0020BF1EBB|nr:GGDEF domain-containing protein [Couchioplanes caeruleus]UQU66819.1 GGDEF domain-containing protein [Couchioplanes caeruleus]
MFTTPLVIATTVAATLGAAVGFLASRTATRPIIATLRDELADAVWQLSHDALTGLHNRTGLRAIHNALAASVQHRQIVTVLIDLDLFKEVNDTYGHDAGDDLLKATATRIARLTALYSGQAARLSGDEFAVIAPLDTARLINMAVLFTSVIAEPVQVRTDDGPVTVTITASLGIAVASNTDLLEGVALHRADTAMYHAKQQGGNRHVFYRPGMAMPSHQPRRGPRLRDRRRSQNGRGA